MQRLVSEAGARIGQAYLIAFVKWSACRHYYRIVLFKGDASGTSRLNFFWVRVPAGTAWAAAAGLAVGCSSGRQTLLNERAAVVFPQFA